MPPRRATIHDSITSWPRLNICHQTLVAY